MRTYFCLLFLFIAYPSAYAQESKHKLNDTISLDAVLKHFQDYHMYTDFITLNDSVTRNTLFRTKEFNVSLSNNPIDLDIEYYKIKNPYGDSNPISYYLIWNDNIISLFDNGEFACYNIKSLERNVNLESKLNTKEFSYHWIIDGMLTATSEGENYQWDNNQWIEYKGYFPLSNRSKLFEDNDFITFSACAGEWGGLVFFWEKNTSNVYFTEATCANTVFKKNEKYIVLSKLGHLMGQVEMKSIEDPRKLTRISSHDLEKLYKRIPYQVKDESGAYKIDFHYWGIEFFSTFEINNRQLYIGFLNEITFIAECEKGEIKIVHSLLSNRFYDYHPVTNFYKDYTIISLEGSLIIISGNKLTKIDWDGDSKE